MTKRLIFCTAISLLAVPVAFAHEGPVDGAGCHMNTKTRDWHCHPSTSETAPSIGSGICPADSEIVGAVCISKAQLCLERLGARSVYRSGVCDCIKGYGLNASGDTCVRDRLEDATEPAIKIPIRRDIADTIERTFFRPVSRRNIADEQRMTMIKENARERKNYEPPEPENYRAKRLEFSKTAVSARTSAEYVQIMRVIDGDSMEVRLVDRTTSTVHLLGITAPDIATSDETPECYASEASQYLKRLLMRKGVTLTGEEPGDDEDRTDLYRYVSRGKTDVGTLLLWQGFVRADRSREHERAENYDQLESEAKQYRRGLWGTCLSARDGR